MGIYELMIMSSTIREMSFKGEPTMNLRRVARKQGMRTLFEDGMIKAIKGLTTLEEVMRITQHEMGGEPAQAK
jgi:type IV pilus assembly protein PilB